MKMSFLGLIGIAAISASAALLLKKEKPELSVLVGVAGGLVLAAETLSQIGALLPVVRDALEKYEYLNAFLSPALKITVLTIAAEATADACRDAGQGFLAGKVELAARVVILAFSLPILIDLMKRIAETLGGAA